MALLAAQLRVNVNPSPIYDHLQGDYKILLKRRLTLYSPCVTLAMPVPLQGRWSIKMNVKCKPGDLAVVVNSQLPCNRGRIVRIISAHDHKGDLIFPSTYGQIWLAESAQPMTWRIDRKRYRRKSGPIPDYCLQPIRGNPLLADEVCSTTKMVQVLRLLNPIRQHEPALAGDPDA